MAKDTADTAREAQEQYFVLTDQVPEEVWYWAAIGSIGLSAALKIMKKDNWALFVGQWPPTFLILAVFHKVLRPGPVVMRREVCATRLAPPRPRCQPPPRTSCVNLFTRPYPIETVPFTTLNHTLFTGSGFRSALSGRRMATPARSAVGTS